MKRSGHELVARGCSVVTALVVSVSALPLLVSGPAEAATITLAGTTTGIAFDSSVGLAFAINQHSRLVSVVNESANTAFTQIRVGAYPVAVASNPTTSTEYVAIGGQKLLDVIDGTSLTVTRALHLTSRPSALAVDTTTNTIVVASATGRTLTLINGATKRVVRTVKIPAGITGLAINNPTSTIYATFSGSNTL